MPPAEVILWSNLKGRQLAGYKFRRQYSIGPYILDFYCPELKLAIEVDGGGHFDSVAIKEDSERQSFIQKFGIKFLRLTSLEVYKNREGIIEAILNTIEKIKTH
ncbi:MAG: endonuclease domain-containing protein [candidate division Zixibacteria bacterium]|nr:endonuclease domain-containing protein [candidate division Zixibacteria bacterium]